MNKFKLHIRSLQYATDCAPTKCSDSQFHNFAVKGKKESRYELTLVGRILYLFMCPHLVVNSGIKLKDGISASPFVILCIIIKLKYFTLFQGNDVITAETILYLAME